MNNHKLFVGNVNDFTSATDGQIVFNKDTNEMYICKNNKFELLTNLETTNFGLYRVAINNSILELAKKGLNFVLVTTDDYNYMINHTIICEGTDEILNYLRDKITESEYINIQKVMFDTL